MPTGDFDPTPYDIARWSGQATAGQPATAAAALSPQEIRMAALDMAVKFFAGNCNGQQVIDLSNLFAAYITTGNVPTAP